MSVPFDMEHAVCEAEYRREQREDAALEALHTPGPWALEGSWRSAEQSGHIISHGTNSYGDGPNGYVFRTIGSTDADARLAKTAPEMLEALYQYESDLMRPPQGDSVQRRLERVRNVIAKALGK